MRNIKLTRIDENNFIQAFNLNLDQAQEQFVSHPIRSLAQAYVYYEQCTPFGIFHGDTMVGYDVAYQHQGFGAIALRKCLDYIASKPFGTSNKVVLTCNKNNAVALRLYKSYGFKETGNTDDDEIELSLFL